MELRSVLCCTLAAYFFGHLGCAHGGPPKGPAVPVQWRPLRVPCLPTPGPVYATQWKALKRLAQNRPMEVSSESGFGDLFGCASGVDWNTERLVLLMLEVRHMDAIRFSQLTLQDEKLRLRIRVDCGPGYDDHSQRLAGSHVFFGMLLPASRSRLEVQYGDGYAFTTNYQQIIRHCTTIPQAPPVVHPSLSAGPQVSK